MTESKKSEKNLKKFKQQIQSSSSIRIKKIKTLMINDRLHFANKDFIILNESLFNKSKRILIKKKFLTISSTKKSKHCFNRAENSLKTIIKQMSFNFNEIFNYFKT